MNRYWWSFVSNDREVVCHAANERETAIATKERMKQSTLAQCRQAKVGTSIRKATAANIRAWAAIRFPGKIVTIRL
jgi:hypothetical protein